LKFLKSVEQLGSRIRSRAGGSAALLVLGAISLLVIGSKYQAFHASTEFSNSIDRVAPKSVRLLWQKTNNVGYLGYVAAGLGELGKRVFWATAGIQAFNARSGDLVWEQGGPFFSAVVASEKRIFAAGDFRESQSDFFVRAQEGTDGNIAWQDRFDLAGGDDRATSLAFGRSRLFAAGSGTNLFGNLDFLVRAYDSKSGNLLWQDLFDTGSDDLANVIAVDEPGRRVFAVGYTNVLGVPGILRAYDASSGALLWQANFDETLPTGMAVGKGRVFVAGIDQAFSFEPNFLVRSYDADSGVLSWQDIVTSEGFNAAALGIVEADGKVFAVGTSAGLTTSNDFLVRAYDPRTGNLLWQDLYDRAHGMEIAYSVVVENGRVFVGGVDEATRQTILRGYSQGTGQLLWDERFSYSAPHLASQSGLLFAAGEIIRAYDVSGLKREKSQDGQDGP